MGLVMITKMYKKLMKLIQLLEVYYMEMNLLGMLTETGLFDIINLTLNCSTLRQGFAVGVRVSVYFRSYFRFKVEAGVWIRPE